MYYNHGQYLIRRELQNNTERPLLHLVGQVVVDMDYDCRGGKLFWIDRNSRSIRSANVDGSSATVLLDGTIFFLKVKFIEEKYFKSEKL